MYQKGFFFRVFFFVFFFGLSFFSFANAADRTDMVRLKQMIDAELVGDNLGVVGYCLTDITTGDSIGQRDDERVNPASVIKVPVMVAVYMAAAQGRLNLSDQIVLTPAHKIWGAGPLHAQKNGRRFPITYLVECMIHFSDNTATKMLIDHVGKSRINQYMIQLGLQKTVIGTSDLLNAYGLNYSTPRDMNLLYAKMAKGRIVSPQVSREMLFILSAQKYRWGIPKSVSKDVLVANKTGTLNGVKHDSGIVFVKNKPYALSVFTTEFKSVFTAMKLISKISELSYHWAN